MIKIKVLSILGLVMVSSAIFQSQPAYARRAGETTVADPVDSPTRTGGGRTYTYTAPEPGATTATATDTTATDTSATDQATVSSTPTVTTRTPSAIGQGGPGSMLYLRAHPGY
jgi:hypothetical protein